MGIRIDADRFAGDAGRLQMGDGLVNVVNAERQMAQAAGLRAADAGRRRRERKQLDSVLPVERQIGFPGAALLAVDFAQQGKSENVAVKMLTGGVVRANDRDMVYLT